MPSIWDTKRVTIFYEFATNLQGGKALMDVCEEGWDQHLKVTNDEFEVFLKGNLDLSKLSGCIFHVWDRNHRL
jgi:hypothetical protein